MISLFQVRNQPRRPPVLMIRWPLLIGGARALSPDAFRSRPD